MWMRTEGILILRWTRWSFPQELLFQFSFFLMTENEVWLRCHLYVDWHWPVITCYNRCLSENVPSYVFFRSRHWRNGVYSRWNGQCWKCQRCWRPLQFAKRFEWRRLHTFPQTECQALIVPELPVQLRTIWLKHLYMNIPEVSTATLPGNPNHSTLTWRFLTHGSLHCNHNIRYCKSWVCCRELWLGTVVT